MELKIPFQMLLSYFPKNNLNQNNSSVERLYNTASTFKEQIVSQTFHSSFVFQIRELINFSWSINNNIEKHNLLCAVTVNTTVTWISNPYNIVWYLLQCDQPELTI